MFLLQDEPRRGWPFGRSSGSWRKSGVTITTSCHFKYGSLAANPRAFRLHSFGKCSRTTTNMLAHNLWPSFNGTSVSSHLDLDHFTLSQNLAPRVQQTTSAESVGFFASSVGVCRMRDNRETLRVTFHLRCHGFLPFQTAVSGSKPSH